VGRKAEGKKGLVRGREERVAPQLRTLDLALEEGRRSTRRGAWVGVVFHIKHCMASKQ